MVNGASVKDKELITYLKKIQVEMRHIDQRLIVTSSNFMCTRMDIVFNTFIQVHSLTDQEIDRLFQLIRKSNVDYRIESIFMAKLLSQFDKLQNIRGRQNVIEKQMFGIHW